jgi:hypothetical protein
MIFHYHNSEFGEAVRRHKAGALLGQSFPVRIEHTHRLLLTAQEGLLGPRSNLHYLLFSVRDTRCHCQFGPPPVLIDTFDVGGGEMAEAADEPLVVDKVISSPRAST